MFNQQITDVQLASKYADELFPNIIGDKFHSDISMTATLRALLHNRVPKEETVIAKMGSTGFDSSTANNIVEAICENLGDTKNLLYIHSLDGDKEGNEACFKELDKVAVEKVFGAGWGRVKDVEFFFERSHVKIVALYNSELESNCIVIERLTIGKWHMLQALIPRFYKKKFFESSPITPEEKEVLTILTSKEGYNRYIEFIAKVSSQFDFDECKIRAELKGYEKKFERKELEHVRRDIEAHQNNIRDYMDYIANCNRVLRDLNIKELGLIARINGEEEGESEIMNLFLKDKSLHLDRVDGEKIYFYITTTAESFNPDTVKRVIKNKGNSFVYRTDGHRYENTEMTDDRIELLMTELFIKQKMKLRLCAAYYVDFASMNYGASGGFSFPDDILGTHLPNPHIQRYNCLGNNAGTIGEAMRERNYAGVIRMIWNSAININFSDNIPCTELMKGILSNSARKIIQMPDGSCLTPLEAAMFLEERERGKVA